jgi:hypothetical protein
MEKKCYSYDWKAIYVCIDQIIARVDERIVSKRLSYMK